MLLVDCNISLAQNKPILYLFFKERISDGMSKQHRKNDNSVKKNGKTISEKYDYDIYTYSDENNSFRYRLATDDKNRYSVKDQAFFMKNGITYDKLKKNKNIYYDSSDLKNFPYAKVFILEYVSQNKYKLIQVGTYLGSDY